MAISSDDVVRTGAPASDVRRGDSEPVGQREINGQRVSVAVSSEHEAPPPPNANIDNQILDDQNANVEQALKPLRAWRVGRAMQHGTRGGATLGAVIGGIVGTVLAPGVGTFAVAYLGALAGAALGRALGWGVGKRQADRTTLDSLQQDIAPGTETFDALARRANVDPGSLSEASRARIRNTLAGILAGMATHGKPVAAGFVERVQIVLIGLEKKRAASQEDSQVLEQMKQAVCDRLVQGLGEWAASDTRIDAAMVERAVRNLVHGRWGMPGYINDPKTVTAAQRQRMVAALDAMMLERARRNLEDFAPDALRAAADAFRYVATSGLDARLENAATAQLHAITTGARIPSGKALEETAVALAGIGRKKELDAGDRQAAMQTLTAAITYRLRQAQAVDQAFVENAGRACIDAFALIAESGLIADLQDAATEQLHAIMARGERLEPAVLPRIADALREIVEKVRDPEGRETAMQSLSAAIDERLRLQRPVDATFVGITAQACIDAEQHLDAYLDANRQLDPAGRRAIRAAYRAPVALAIKAGEPLTEEVRRALLESRVAIQQASDLSDQQHDDALKTFGSVISKRLDRNDSVTADLVAQTRDHAILVETVLAAARLDQEPDLPRDSIAAIEQGCREIVSSRLALGCPTSEQQMQAALETLKDGMRWSPPEGRGGVRALEKEADQKAEHLVDRLLDENVKEAALLSALRQAYAATARHTMAGARGFDRAAIRAAFAERIRFKVRARAGTVAGINVSWAYAVLTGFGGTARALTVALSRYGSSRPLRGLEHGDLTPARVYRDALVSTLDALSDPLWTKTRDIMDIRRLEEATADLFKQGDAATPTDRAIRQKLRLHMQDLDSASDAFLDFWPDAHAELICLRHSAARIPNPEAVQPQRQQAAWPQAPAMPGDDEAVMHRGDGHDSDEDGDGDFDEHEKS